MSAASRRLITDLLAARTGQTLSENREWRIDSALAGIFRERGLENVDQLACLLTQPGQGALAQEVVEALLNNETYFFRDRALFAHLSDRVLPDLARRRQAMRKLRIWSAGCSTGQEALSLAMLFSERGEEWAGWRIEILGTDISQSAIETAQSGLYSQFEVQRGLGIAQMLEHFHETGKGWRVSGTLQRMIRFQRRNLLDRPPSPGCFDLILCRNVLLYFDPVTRQKACARLHEALAGDGWLMLGAGESFHSPGAEIEPVEGAAALLRNPRKSESSRPIPRRA